MRHAYRFLDWLSRALLATGHTFPFTCDGCKCDQDIPTRRITVEVTSHTKQHGETVSYWFESFAVTRCTLCRKIMAEAISTGTGETLRNMGSGFHGTCNDPITEARIEWFTENMDAELKRLIG